MGKPTPQVQVTSSLEPKDVPFVGWSQAAHAFRIEAATLAPKGILPLLIGYPGVGKRCMARAWRDVAGFGAEIPIIDLDQVAVELPPKCIGFTTRRPERHRACFRLDEGVMLYVPPGRKGQPILPSELMQHFGIALYMPPIHQHREIDLLAHLDYCNKVRFPRSGFRYRGISVPLINRLFFDNDWPSNLRGLSRFLENVSDLDRRQAKSNNLRNGVLNLGTLRDHPEIRMFNRPSPRDPEARIVDWICDAEDVPIRLIPDLAVRIFHWDCRHGPLRHPDSEDPDSELRRMLLPETLCQRSTGLRVRDFLRMTAEDYTRDILFLGLDVDDPKRPDRKVWFSTMLNHVERDSHFGATFSSLQAGLAMDSKCTEVLSTGTASPASSGIHVPSLSNVGTAGQHTLAKADLINRFERHDGLFHLEFHADGYHEKDDILLRECIGLAYYELLLRNPGLDLEAERLHSFGKSKEKPGRFLQLSKSGVESNAALSNRDVSTTSRALRGKREQDGRIDQRARQNALDRLKAIKQDKDKARELGKFGEIPELEEQEREIKSYLNRNTYHGQIKDQGPVGQSYVENTGKNLRNALARIRKKMPGLAGHLEQFVKSKAGRWKYNPRADVVFHFSDE